MVAAAGWLAYLVEIGWRSVDAGSANGHLDWLDSQTAARFVAIDPSLAQTHAGAGLLALSHPHRAALLLG